MTEQTTGRTAIILLAKSAVTATPLAEMEAVCALVRRTAPDTTAVAAYSEQGTPSLRDALLSLRAEGVEEVHIVPLLLPMEPAFRVWIRKAVARWQRAFPGDWPLVRLGAAPTESPALAHLTEALVASARSGEVLAPPKPRKTEGSMIPAQKRRVLVCAGGPCNDAGSALIWGYLRNEQERLNLRHTGEGTMTCKSTCLGPCALAPVVQVWPEGTFYGEVDEEGIDLIIREHLQNGRIAEAYVSRSEGKKVFPKRR